MNSPAPSYKSYTVQNQLSGWTRIDMLLAIYDRAIASVQSMASAETSNPALMSQYHFEAQKYLLAIHAGLKPEQDVTAFNVARLIHFVSVSLEKRQFTDALRVLESLRNGFEAIREEATRLELEGHIQPLETSQGLNTIV